MCTLCLGVGSEVAQHLLPNDREFDPWDVLANVVGSLAALGLASAYHRRAAERRRRAKFSALASDGLEGDDLELGEGANRGLGGSSVDDQETGVVTRTVEEELDNWDENVADDAWDEEDDATTSGQNTKVTPSTSSPGSEEPPRKLVVD